MSETEIWKDIKGYEGLYQLSNLGRVKSLDKISNNGHHLKKKMLKPIEDEYGYMHVILYKKNTKKIFRTHRLVAQEFISNPLSLPQINHKDERKSNNCVSNLEWVTVKQNMNYGTRNKRAISNTCKPVVAIDKFGKKRTFKSIKQAAEVIGTASHNISATLHGHQQTSGGYSFQYENHISNSH
ncbi:NUMOD4 domain-containing protein [Oenococcus sicerae]|uniref:Endonuclease n=1 Tax=Oenococcus sicerae TaxID=2203724 RepID=A0AAJ1VPY8_9LACO|nr:NUMOD4 domain-containing protein [Oenococcus sicerae]MDN6899557.1 endonuclease [Oenococcus sicerae]